MNNVKEGIIKRVSEDKVADLTKAVDCAGHHDDHRCMCNCVEVHVHA
jgi:hypothetical protein